MDNATLGTAPAQRTGWRRHVAVAAGLLVTADVAALLLAGLGAGHVPAPSAALAEPPAAAPTSDPVRVIARWQPGHELAGEAAVAALGGTVGIRIPMIGGFTATIPGTAVGPLAHTAGVANVSLDRRVALLDRDPSSDDPTTASSTSSTSSSAGYDPAGDPGSLYNVARAIGANDLWNSGSTGKGIGIALIDSGLVRTPGRLDASTIVQGPDLSFDGADPALATLDAYGHGTHMAAIIAGRDRASSDPATYDNKRRFAGIAPDATLVNVKVAAADGQTDVSQVIAGIDWVVQHKDEANIRVINLSFGTDGAQARTIDPLAYAVEVAWRKGIVVVVAGGNDGTSLGRLTDPAYDPFVLAVGATDHAGTAKGDDDTVADFSSRGTADRSVDLVAPGRSIVSARSPGSYVDTLRPTARVADTLFRGSGTSQATAVTSGAVALLLQQRPQLTPDQVKRLLTNAAAPIAGATAIEQGAGRLDVKRASKAAIPGRAAIQRFDLSTGTGSIEASRGSFHVTSGDRVLAGEVDASGTPWDGGSWSGAAWSGGSWSGGSWSGGSWSGGSWSGGSWSGGSWSGGSWSGGSWSGGSWSGGSWSGGSWSGGSWSGGSWSGGSWSDAGWLAAGWPDT